jgi:hypothetical protein
MGMAYLLLMCFHAQGIENVADRVGDVTYFYVAGETTAGTMGQNVV